MNQQGHIQTLNGLRGVAAIAVVVGHMCGALFDSPIFKHGSLSVDFFFILSGFVISRAYEHKFQAGMKFRDYAKVRLERLYPLMALGIVVGFVVTLFGAKSPNHPVLVTMAQLAFVPALWTYVSVFPLNNVQWSLLVELV